MINPTIIQIGTGRIDANYMNSRFIKFLKALPGSAQQQALLDELHRSFATLGQEDQRYAKQILADIQNGNLTVDPLKTFTDYIAEYAERAKNDQVHQFADAFGACERLLRIIMSHPVTATTLNQFNRFDALIKTVDRTKAAAYFSAVEGHPVSAFSVTSKVDEIFRRFILQGGFPIEKVFSGTHGSEASMVSYEAGESEEFLEAAGLPSRDDHDGYLMPPEETLS